MLVPTSAYRDEGVSYHYSEASDYLEIETAPALMKILDEMHVPYNATKTWTTDAIYRETKEKMEKRKAAGCICVEMECSALAACAEFRDTEFGMILYTADTLADIDKYDERHWGGDIEEYALELCLDAVLRL